MKFIDTHSHIHFLKSFPDQLEVLERARVGGVEKQVLVGCNMEDSWEAAAFVRGRDGLAWTIGIHPHDADQASEENLNKIRAVLSGEENLGKMPVAVGEIGLDYFRNLQPVEVQQKAFAELLGIAREFDLPVVVHIRDAYEDAFEILEQAGNTKVILHCFSGGMKEAKLAWSRGYITSFSGVVTYPKNIELQEVAKIAPENLFVLETDCPFLSPQVHRGQRNEPAYVVDTAKFVADLRAQTLENIAEITTANAERVLGI
jgi:TatD DNase family protein